ncbi:Zn-dependent exopeptidase [Trametes versicolor FP-101664 SS1]|uniref:Zn-dependent exopeptidase n=1 Tax=Trametes versicolor (strain FP-101664) TaxID=717944 RepID=UPI00046213A7|nr:Zn-dependent exopeptidase [Trametes versicolor FP-101664 SS1]EIW53574.1 Zn-dependent exopeptidase [Trametes versicolor FP-101664 SS1]
MSNAEVPPEFSQYIEDHQQQFIDRLAEAVAIRSVSGDPALRPSVTNMGCWLKKQLEDLGVSTQCVDLGPQDGQGDGEESLHLPPLILGRVGEDPAKKTVLVYGHYDVQPAEQSDGWNTDPWKLDQNDDTGRLTGRGATDDKGPVLGWLNVLEAHHALGLELPVNLRFCFEGMEESGSDGLDEFIAAEAAKGKDGYFDGVSGVCISDNYWLNARTPCVTYGLRGVVTFQMTVCGPKEDLHSGMFGRMVHEPMTDLAILMSKLVAPCGKILIDEVENMVPAPTDEERKEYENLDYTKQDLVDAVGADIGLSDDPAELLMGRMRYPSLSLHGIEGAYSGPGVKTVIPAKVTAKFSIRIVSPYQPSEEVAKAVQEFVEGEFAKIDTKNKLKFETLDAAEGWVTEHPKDDWNYQAAIRATEAVYKRTPDLTREGGSIPVTLTFANNLPGSVSVVLLPMGRGDDGAHSTNEKIDRSNFIEGSKMLGVYLYEVAASAKN